MTELLPLSETPRCRRCNSSGWEKFDWQGYCLMCEDDDGNDCVQVDYLEEEHI